MKSEEQPARRQLDRVLESAGFARNERMSRFLRFVVERQLAGRDQELKESVIAVEIFGRSPDYNPKRDPIVRTEASRLRARLSEYYIGEGRADTLVIELPKGGYAPAFRQAEAAPAGIPSSDDPQRTTRSARVRLRVALACFAAVVAAVGWWRFPRAALPIPIAVLPLVNLSQDPANEYFADGLTAEIIRNLAIIEGLAVRSQTSAFVFKGKPRNMREAGRQLDADYILEGSVLRAGERLRINAQLVRVHDDFPVWANRYDRELKDVFTVQDEISRGIVNSLRLKLGKGRRRYETSVEAYDFYLHARAMPIQKGALGYDQSIAPLEAAIAKDPSFAPAYAGLAVAHAARSGQFRFDLADEMSRMRAAAEKAIQLDPLLAEAHHALGTAYSRDAQWEQSEKSFRRAIEIDPNSPESHGDFALFLLLPLGRMEEALQQAHAAEKADPLSPWMHSYVAYVLTSAGRYDEAAGICEKLPADYAFKSHCLGRARLGQGRFGEAIPIFETALNQGFPPADEMLGELGYCYGRAGRRQDAEKLAAASSSRHPFNQALIFAGLGDKDRTFEALDRAAAAGPFRIGRALTWPEMSLLRGDPRLKALRKKVGLPE